MNEFTCKNWENILVGVTPFYLKNYERIMHRKNIMGWLLLSSTDTLKKSKEREN
jgi:hypothetical protein